MKVTKYRSAEKSGHLVGYFNIIFKSPWGGGFFINDMKLWMKDGRRWVSFPDRKYENEHGETKYFPYCGFSQREVSDKFQEEAIKAIEEFCAKNNQAPSVKQTAPVYVNNSQRNEPALAEEPPEYF
jgi:hypothetical protein